MQPTIYVDLRCLQDPAYRVRGIGHHVAALLRTRRQSGCAQWKTVGLIDPSSDPIQEDCASLLDEVSASLNPVCDGAPAVFIDGTPMTHDTRFSIRFQSHPAFFNAAVVYDFIPLEWPGYLPNVSKRVDYLGKMARLRNFDLFLPISEYTGWRLSELLGVPRSRMCVTGASVRRSLYEIRDRLQPASQPGDDPYFLTFAAADIRKNAAIVAKAVRRLNLIHGKPIRLKVAGHDYQAFKRELLSSAGQVEGKGFLEFCAEVPDEELVSLFRGAIATVVPSHIEGFSLPVVEASVCGCPVVASGCAAHLELIEQDEALFPSDDLNALTERLDALLGNRDLQASLVASQCHLGAKFHENEVGKRFWNAIESALAAKSGNPAVLRRQKPKLAFLSPFPPDRSGVARYTAMTMEAGSRVFDSNLYSDAPRPLAIEGDFLDAGRVSAAPLITGEYNGIISVLGNSHFHSSIFDVFEKYGGPCILHDARLIQIYVDRLGPQEFLKLVGRILDRKVGMEEVSAWVQGRNPASTLLEYVVSRASPLIVHTATQRTEIKRRYGVDAQVLPCCPTVFFDDAEVTDAARDSARERHGLSADRFLISTFGNVGPEKGLDVIIPAIELLRSWNIPADLYFVGDPNLYKSDINRLAELYDIADHVHSAGQFVDDLTYREFLVGSDAAVQLRTFGFGQFSAALTDCISAGLRSVASSELAQSCDAPEFVSVVPDQFSPLHVAEQLALVWESRNEQGSTRDARCSYLERHNFHRYADQLLEVLGLA